MSMHISIPRTIRRVSTIAALAALTVATAACGSDTKTSSATAAAPTTTAPATTMAAGAVSVTKPWARTSPSNAATGAAYFTITSPVDDTLTGVSVDPSVAKMAQMHETSMGGGMTATTMAGATTTTPQMTMTPVAKIELKAGTPVEFKPGGYHIMMMELAKPLKVGDTITITLTLAKAGTVTVQAPVLDEAP
jgi:copper(I)-binding protein